MNLILILIKLKLNKSKYRQSTSRIKDAEAAEQCILEMLRRKSQRNSGLFSLKASGGTKIGGRSLIKIKGQLGIGRKVSSL